METVLPAQWRVHADNTFVPLDAREIVRAAQTLIALYLDSAPALARSHGVDYPGALQRAVEPWVQQVFARSVSR